eukprot:Clim_evm27s108 gene=Clim_evmTU27s108
MAAEKEDIKRLLIKALGANAILTDLSKTDQRVDLLVDNCIIERYKKGEIITQQGAKNQDMYVLAEGSVHAVVEKGEEKKRVVVDERGPGQAFGELAFVYDAPRSESIVAMEDVVVYRLPESLLQKHIEDSEMTQNRFRVKRWLRDVLERHQFFAHLDDDRRREEVIQEFRASEHAEGTDIVRQGQESDGRFYIVEQGHCDILVKKGEKDKEHIVGHLDESDSFGELSLIYNTPRQATVRCTDASVVWSIDGETFRRVSNFGSLALLDAFLENANVELEGEKYMTVQGFGDLLSKNRTGIHLSPATQQLIFLLADQTGAQLLSFSEFVILHMLMQRENAAYEIAFRFFDHKKDGVIWKDEFERAIKVITSSQAPELEEHGLAVSADQVLNEEYMEKLFGVDGEGYLTYEEFEEELHRGGLKHLTSFWDNVADSLERISESYMQTAVETGEDGVVAMPQRTTYRNAWKYLVAGGVAGAVSRTAVSPIIRLKMLLQTQGKPPRYTGIVQGLTLMYREDGIRGFYRGNLTNVIRIAPTSAFQFFFYELYKSTLLGEGTRDLSVPERLLAGGFAGITAASLTYPLDFIRARLTVQHNDNMQYKGIADGVRQVVQKEGFFALYRGLWPTIVGVFPYIGIDFAVYETLRPYIPRNPNTDDPSVVGLLAVGGFAGAVSQTIAFPLELVRRRLQVQGFVHSEYNYSGGIWNAITLTVRKEGVRGLYSGLSANYIKAVPSIGIGFVVYERMKNVLGIHDKKVKVVSAG